MESPPHPVPKGPLKRSFLQRALTFWRGGVVIGLAALASLLALSLIVTEVYESEAEISWTPASPPLAEGAPEPSDEILGEKARALLRDPRRLEPLARELQPGVAEGKVVLEAAVESARKATDFVSVGPHRWALKFRSHTADLAQYGCERLANFGRAAAFDRGNPASRERRGIAKGEAH